MKAFYLAISHDFCYSFTWISLQTLQTQTTEFRGVGARSPWSGVRLQGSGNVALPNDFNSFWEPLADFCSLLLDAYGQPSDSIGFDNGFRDSLACAVASPSSLPFARKCLLKLQS